MAPRVWCRCGTPADEDLALTLHDALTEEGDAVDLVLTGIAARPNPSGRRDARQLIERETPHALVWLGGTLDLGTLQAATDAGLTVVLVNMTEQALDPVGGFLQRGRLRAVLAKVDGVYTRDPETAAAFRHAGALRLHPTTLLEPAATVLPHVETDRRDLAEALNSRSVWMACGVTPAQVAPLVEAHRVATRRSHRLLLVADAANPAEGPELAAHFSTHFLQTRRSTVEPIPQEAVQVHVADSPGDLGLWLRLASVTLASGTLTDGSAQDPFEIATLGSGLLHGPHTAPHSARYERLRAAGAARRVGHWSSLGPAVEECLAADRVARMVTSGWDVTSRGAQTAVEIAALLRARLDRVA